MNPLGAVKGFVGKGGTVDHWVGGAVHGAGHGLGWLWGQGVQTYTGPLSTLLGLGGKAAGTVSPGAGALLGATGKGFTMLGQGAKVLGSLGWKGLALAGAGIGAALLFLGGMFRRGTPAGRVATVLTPRGGRHGYSRTRINIGGGGGGGSHPILTLILILLAVIYVVPVAHPQIEAAPGTPLLNGGRVVPAGYDGCAVQTAAPLPVGGWDGIASALGHAVHAVDRPPLESSQVADWWIGTLHHVGGLWAEFRNGAKGGPTLLQDAPTAPGAPLSPAQQVSAPQAGDTAAVALARYAVVAFPEDPVHAVAIAGAESGWDRLATHLNSDATASHGATTDYGVFQINSYWHADLLATGDWRDLATNVRWARMIYDEAGGSWSPWSTEHSGAWQGYVQQATQAVAIARGALGPYTDPQPPTTEPVAQTTCPTAPGTVPVGFPGKPGPKAVEDAIAYAMAQIGDPYVFGAAGPDSWDCSSLVDVAYGLDPVGGAHGPTTGMLITMGTAVPSQAALLRGDLVFTTLGHVGIALDADTMVVAPHTGDHVKVESIYAFTAGRRLVPATMA